jgi:hypothetical protein
MVPQFTSRPHPSSVAVLLASARRWVHKTHLRGVTGRNLGNQVMGVKGHQHTNHFGDGSMWVYFYTQLRTVPHLLDAPTSQLPRSIWIGNNDFVSSALTGDQCTLITYQTRPVCTTEMETRVPSLTAKLRVFLATSQKTILITRNPGEGIALCLWLAGVDAVNSNFLQPDNSQIT